ncbi:MAG: enoyl-CoA hydratase/isomerase family protein [Thermoplasmata archaeon]|nr:MAG: enoyl-CoA hydratase/isomerase family protein [Thermoplasmata archaeon]
MELVEIEHYDRVTELKLNNGITNALSLEFIRKIFKSLKDLKDDPAVNGVAITTNNHKFFSIGFDIPSLYDLNEQDFRIFYRTYNRLCMDLYTYPKPTIAAITGHAIAGGCILALCCDFRFIGEGRKLMGLNEVKLGVPVPYPGDCVLRQLVGPQNAQIIMEKGLFYPSEELLQMGIVDRVIPVEQVNSKAIDRVKLAGNMPNEAFNLIKRNRQEIVEKQVLKHLAKKEKTFIESWFSDEARKLLKEGMEKF